MERKIKGIALLLFSILLTLGFDAMDWTWFQFAFFEIRWAAIFILLGAAGLAMTLWPEDQ
ncbi:MAG: hypothetical protein K2P33_10905 [Acutalibacter sp.]|nr:hypothetical protein [Acutalibacter sp.]